MRFTLFIFILFICGNVQASRWEPQRPDELKITAGPQLPGYGVTVNAPQDETLDAIYESNVGSKIYLGLSYRNLGVSIGLGQPVDRSTVPEKGESRATDFHFRAYGKRTYEFSYQSYEGFYLRNTDAIASGLAPAGTKYQRPDIKTRHLGAVMHWNLKEDDYTLAVGFGQDGHQLQSGWAYFLSATVGDNKISANEALVPPSVTSQFGRLGTLRELERKYAGVGGALGGIWARGPWYLTGFAAIGPSWQKVEGRFVGSEDFNESFVGFFSDAKIGGGYNGETHVFDIQLHSDNTTTDFLGGTVDTIQLEARFTYSYRIMDMDFPILNSLSAVLD